MTVWPACSMEKCLTTSRPNTRITVQVIVDIVLWFTVAVPLLYIFLAGIPHDRGFFCDDVTIMYPYKEDTISTSMLLILGFGITVVVIILVEVLKAIEGKCRRRFTSFEDVVYVIKCYAVFLVGFVVTQTFVEVVKNETGRLRPNFMDVCRPEFNRSQCPGYVSEYRCTGNAGADEVRDSRQSFPSGHAAFAMYIAVYFVFYIHHRLQITFSRTLKGLLQLALLFTATVCGFGRVADNKHHMIDVYSGFFVGTMVAVILYKTLARSIMKTRVTSKVRFQDDSAERDPCYSCEGNLTDPTTPTPLLAAEFTNGNVNGFSNSHPLKDVKYNARRHMSAPNTAMTSVAIV